MKIKKNHILVMISSIIIIGIIGVFTTEFNVKNNSETQITISENPEIEIHSTEEELTEQEKIAIKTVQEYKGIDNQGTDIASLLGQIITSKFSDEIIFDTNTKLGWSAYTVPENSELYGVTFDFKSTADEFSFVWYVNLQDDTIFPVGGGAEEILEIINTEK